MINLLPPKRLMDMRIARSNTVLRRYIRLVSVGLVIIIATLITAHQLLQGHQDSVRTTLRERDKQVSELRAVQDEAEGLSVTIDTIAELMSRNVVFSDMLSNIGATMPTGAALTGLQFSIENPDAPFIISADVASEERAAVLRNNLIASGIFESADIRSISIIEESKRQSKKVSDSDEQTESLPASPEYRYTAVIHTKLLPGDEQ